MNAIGIMANASQAGSSVNGAVTSSSNVTQSGSGKAAGFAGMLVQIVGGAPNAANESKSLAAGLPAGMLGLLGVLGASTEENAAVTDLMKLVEGILKQLDKLDAQSGLPDGLQDQLTALLLMLQQALQTPVGNVGPQQNADGSSSGNPAAMADGAAGLLMQHSPVAQMTLIQALRQSLQQLTAKLAQGETLNVPTEALSEPLREALNALRQQSAGHSQTNSPAAVPQEGAHASAAPADRAVPSQPAVQADQAHSGIKSESGIKQQSALPLRTPVWAFQAASATASDGGQPANGQPAAVQPDTAETGSLTSTAPIWTMLKGDNVGLLSGTNANQSAPPQVPVGQFTEQMGKFLVKQFVLSQGNGTSEARISLHPEHLGQVDIKLVIQNGLLTAKFMTENGAARDLLEAQMSQLRTALQGQGLQVDKMEVVQQSSAGAPSFFQQQHRQQSSSNRENHAGDGGSSGSYDDAVEFELELERTAYLRESGFGGSLNVTA